MNCPGKDCYGASYTLVLSDCRYHGGYTAVLYEHDPFHAVDDQILVASGQFGSLYGEHEFYDSVMRMITEAMTDLCDLG